MTSRSNPPEFESLVPPTGEYDPALESDLGLGSDPALVTPKVPRVGTPWLASVSVGCSAMGLALALFAAQPLIGLFLCTAGVITGSIDRRRADPEDATRRRLARAGILIGWIGIGLAVAVAVILGVVITTLLQGALHLLKSL